MASIDSLIANLAAEDLSIRLYAILTLHDRKDEPGLAAKLAAAGERESDPALRLYLGWLADAEVSPAKTAGRSALSLLEQPEID